jgi:hypothetical protein
MGADLRSNTTFQRVSVVLMDDALFKLEHERTRDRVRRFSYESISRVVIWQRIPWLRLLVCFLFIVGPGVAVFFIQNTAAYVCGSILIVIGGLVMLWYAYSKFTTIRIIRGTTHNDISGLFRPGKLRKFRERLFSSIRAKQASAP